MTEEDGWTHPGNKEYKDWTDADVDWIQGQSYTTGVKSGKAEIRSEVETFVREELGKRLSIEQYSSAFSIPDKAYKEVLVALITKISKDNER